MAVGGKFHGGQEVGAPMGAFVGEEDLAFGGFQAARHRGDDDAVGSPGQGVTAAGTTRQAATRLKVRLRRQHRIYNPDRPLRLWVVLDESALRRVVGSPDIMREQLEHLNALGAEPHITVQVHPYTAGAHAALSGQFSILQSADSPGARVVYLERFTSDIYLEKPSEVQHYSAMYDHLQAQALDPDSSRDLITEATKTYIDAASRP